MNWRKSQVRKNVSIQDSKLGWPSRLPGVAVSIQGPVLFFVLFLNSIWTDLRPLTIPEAFSFSLQFFQSWKLFLFSKWPSPFNLHFWVYLGWIGLSIQSHLISPGEEGSSCLPIAMKQCCIYVPPCGCKKEVTLWHSKGNPHHLSASVCKMVQHSIQITRYTDKLEQSPFLPKPLQGESHGFMLTEEKIACLMTSNVLAISLAQFLSCISIPDGRYLFIL